MPTIDIATAWITEHGPLLSAVGVASVALLGVTLALSPWLVARLPADYFSAPRSPLAARGLRRLALLAVRNVAGVAFAAIGLVMLITPGPGLVGILLGLSLCEFPGKHALIVRLVTRPDVFRSLNWLRRRGDAPPFLPPGHG